MVQPGQHAGDRLPFLSGPPAADAAGEEKNHRRRGGHVVGVHEHSPSRSRARCSALLSAPAQSPLAAAVRSIIETLSEILPPEPCQPAFRPAPAALVCAEPSGRGLRRNICGLAATALKLAHALCRLAGTEKARIRRWADGRDRQPTTLAHAPWAGRP